MTPTSLIIVTDRGSLKAYKVNETPTRGPSLQLVQAFDTTDAHGRYQDKLTDQAGAFPSGAAPGQGNSIAERTGIDIENDRRIFKQLADSIVDIVEREGKDGWSFAAPASIHAAVVDLLPAAGARPDCRACEIGPGQNRAGEIGDAFSIFAADVTLPQTSGSLFHERSRRPHHFMQLPINITYRGVEKSADIDQLVLDKRGRAWRNSATTSTGATSSIEQPNHASSKGESVPGPDRRHRSARP